MNEPCPHCPGKLRIRTSKRLRHNVRAYRECTICDYADVAIIEPARVVRVRRSCKGQRQPLTEIDAPRKTA